MKAADLIEMLKLQPGDAIVTVFDEVSSTYIPVTGFDVMGPKWKEVMGYRADARVLMIQSG